MKKRFKSQKQASEYLKDYADIMVFNNMSLEYPDYKKSLLLKIKWVLLEVKWWFKFRTKRV